MQKRQKAKAKAEDKYVGYIKKLCEYFRRAVFAGEYKMDVAVDCELGENAVGKLLASIGVDTTYLTLEVRISKYLRTMFEEGRYRTVADTICHEFCHVLTEPLYELALEDAAPSQLRRIEEVRERQTERVAASLFQLVPEKVWQVRTKKGQTA